MKKILIKRGSPAVCYAKEYGPCFGRTDLRVATGYNIHGMKDFYDDTKINYFKTSVGKSFASTEGISNDSNLGELEVFHRVFN